MKTASAHTMTLFLPFLSQQSVTDDLLNLLNIVETLRVDHINQIIVTAVKQEMLDVIGCVCTAFRILNQRRPFVPVQSQ